MFVVLVCGGRDYSDAATLDTTLDDLHQRNRFTHVIHGAASGADSLAGAWARKRGVQEVSCAANWSYFDRAAGHIRNRAMADLSPDLVVAFPGGPGTANMVSLAKARNLPYLLVPDKTA